MAAPLRRRASSSTLVVVVVVASVAYRGAGFQSLKPIVRAPSHRTRQALSSRRPPFTYGHYYYYYYARQCVPRMSALSAPDERPRGGGGETSADRTTTTQSDGSPAGGGGNQRKKSRGTGTGTSGADAADTETEAAPRNDGLFFFSTRLRALARRAAQLWVSCVSRARVISRRWRRALRVATFALVLGATLASATTNYLSHRGDLKTDSAMIAAQGASLPVAVVHSSSSASPLASTTTAKDSPAATKASAATQASVVSSEPTTKDASSSSKPAPTEVPWSEFVASMRARPCPIEDVVVSASRYEFTTRDGASHFASPLPAAGADAVVEEALKSGVAVRAAPVPEKRGLISLPTLIGIVYLCLIFSVLRTMLSGGVGQVGRRIKGGRSRRKNNARGRDGAASFEEGVTLDDVAGISPDARAQVEDLRDLVTNGKKYAALGARLPRGVLLVGPPGTGKTLLARALANEAKVPFVSVSGSDFVEIFAGRGAARVRALFQRAAKLGRCIVFIDELDAVGRARRDGPSAMVSNDEQEQTLNQLLEQMDGFARAPGVIVLAATNRLGVLDPALTRPGRFDRIVRIDPPDADGRLAQLKLHASRLNLDPDLLRQRPTTEVTAAQPQNAADASVEATASKSAQLSSEQTSKSTESTRQKLPSFGGFGGGFGKGKGKERTDSGGASLVGAAAASSSSSSSASTQTTPTPTALDVVLRPVADATPGFVGADMAALCNEAAICAVRADRAFVVADDFKAALATYVRTRRPPGILPAVFPNFRL